jgi:hypothetical protein
MSQSKKSYKVKVLLFINKMYSDVNDTACSHLIKKGRSIVDFLMKEIMVRFCSRVEPVVIKTFCFNITGIITEGKNQKVNNIYFLECIILCTY